MPCECQKTARNIVRLGFDHDMAESEGGETAILDKFIKCGQVFWVSIAVNDTSQGAVLVFGGADRSVAVGVELGSTPYQAPFDIGELQFTPGAAGGSMAVWIDEPICCGRC